MSSGIGERLRMARRIRMLSLQEVADAVGITKTAVSKYENEKTAPNSSMLIQLSRVLQQPLEYFLRGPIQAELQPDYRRRASVSETSRERVEAEVLEWLERYLDVEQLYPAEAVGAFVHPFGQKRTVASEADIEQAALDLRREWHIGDDAIENVTEMLEDHGIKTGLINGVNGYDACAIALDDGAPVIVAAKGRPADRQRFSLAHELGHLLLEPTDNLDCEKSMHRFAAGLLVPAHVARRELGERRHALGLGELLSLKAKYGMSVLAWIRRARDLGIIGESSAKTLYMEASKRGWRTEEPDAGLLPETPQRMYRLVQRALAEGVITDSRANELLGTSTSSTAAPAAETGEVDAALALALRN